MYKNIVAAVTGSSTSTLALQCIVRHPMAAEMKMALVVGKGADRPMRKENKDRTTKIFNLIYFLYIA